MRFLSYFTCIYAHIFNVLPKTPCSFYFSDIKSCQGTARRHCGCTGQLQTQRKDAGRFPAGTYRCGQNHHCSIADRGYLLRIDACWRHYFRWTAGSNFCMAFGFSGAERAVKTENRIKNQQAALRSVRNHRGRFFRHGDAGRWPRLFLKHPEDQPQR